MSHRNNSLSMRRKNNMAITGQNQNTNSNGLHDGNGKGMSCSTPEPNRAASSPLNSDSDTASPVPFLCTQDGSYGDTEVVWNYYTPRADRDAPPRTSYDTPLSRKSKRSKLRNKISQLQPLNQHPTQLKRKPKEGSKKLQLYQDLLEMNKNIQGFLERTQIIKDQDYKSGSEEDIFNSSGDRSPKADGFTKSGSRCLRRNLLNSKYSRAEPEPVLESDDSMNECLIRASQMIEEKVFTKKNASYEIGTTKKYRIKPDSIDAVIDNISLESPPSKIKKTMQVEDSFDNFVGNMNDSALEQLTQLPIINESPRHRNEKSIAVNCVKPEPISSPVSSRSKNSSGWTIKELIALDTVPSPRCAFGRHNSMPESPAPSSRSVAVSNKPSTSGTALSRHSSMPWKNESTRQAGNSSGDSTPLQCTPEEIKRKHQQAREKLLAKRLFPNGNTQSQSTETQTKPPSKFQPKSSTKPSQQSLQTNSKTTKTVPNPTLNRVEVVTNDVAEMKFLIEKKRKEALQKLKMKRIHSMQ